MIWEHGIFYSDTISRGLPTKAEESPVPMRQTSPRRTPTRYFVVSGRAYSGNLICPRQNSTTGCSLKSYPGHLLSLLFDTFFSFRLFISVAARGFVTRMLTLICSSMFTAICCSDLYIDNALRRRCVVLVRTIFCISCKFGFPGIALR